MPAAIQADWEQAKALYIQGLLPAAIADRLNIPVNTLRKRIHRGKWPQLRDKSRETLGKTGPSDMSARAASWQEQVADLMETRLNHLKTISPDKLKLSDLETLARITELTDKQARRTFGLDQQQSPVSVGLVGITLHVQAYEPKPEQGAIDVAGNVVDEGSTSVKDGAP